MVAKPSRETMLPAQAGEGGEKQARSEQRQRLNALAQSLLKKRDEAVLYRSTSGVEKRWREDEAAFDAGVTDSGHQSSMIDYATGEASRPATTGGPIRSRVVVNVLRPKCETAEGRFSDLLLPVDDRNFGLDVTPVPDLVKGLKDDRQPIDTSTNQPMVAPDGKPVKTSDIARAKMDKAKEAMKGMQDEIDDQLNECSFNGECREVIRDAVRAGTGVLKGPSVIKQIRRAWVPKTDGERTVHVMQAVENPRPMSKRVDYWNCYPDPHCGSDIKRASYMWEYDEILPRELRLLSGLDGYFDDQIRAALLEEPVRTQAAWNSKDKRTEIRRDIINPGSAYEKWEYHGDVDREDLLALGIDTADQVGKSVSACIVFVNDRPIKVQLNVLDSGDIPYDFFQWSEVKGSPWGIGIVRVGTWAQRVITAAWQATMDNARDSSGANVVLGKGIEPADGKWELTGKKAWLVTGDLDDVRKAFAQFQLESRQVELQAVIEMAIKFLDMETAIPMLFQGEGQEAPETLGATNIMVDSNNVALRTRVKRWDDKITRPHISRYYDWNMQYSDNPEIKGDFSVDARGTSVLLARDQQSRTLVNLMALRGDPRVDKEVDWGKAVRELFTALRLNVLKSDEDKKRDEDAAKNNPPPQDPKIQSTTIRTQGELQKAELTQQSDMRELEFKAQESERQRQHEADIKTAELQMKMMEFSERSGLTLAQIKADLAKEASKQNLMRELADKKTAELTRPPVEPPQKAPAGEAYQQ